MDLAKKLISHVDMKEYLQQHITNIPLPPHMSQFDTIDVQTRREAQTNFYRALSDICLRDPVNRKDQKRMSEALGKWWVYFGVNYFQSQRVIRDYVIECETFLTEQDRRDIVSYTSLPTK